MIKLNILPLEYKKGLLQKKGKVLVLGLWLIVIFIFIVTIGVVSVSRSLSGRLSDLTARVEVQQEVAERVTLLNRKISQINKIQSSYKQYGEIVSQLPILLFPKIEVDHVILDSVRETITIDGKAEKREDLVALKDRLEDSDIFSDVDLALGGVEIGKEISFRISAKAHYLSL